MKIVKRSIPNNDIYCDSPNGYYSINNKIFYIKNSTNNTNYISMNELFRRYLNLKLEDSVEISPIKSLKFDKINFITLNIENIICCKQKNIEKVDENDFLIKIKNIIIKSLYNIIHKDLIYILRGDLDGDMEESTNEWSSIIYFRFDNNYLIENPETIEIQIKDNIYKSKYINNTLSSIDMFKKLDIRKDLEIGGLDNEINRMIREVFISRTKENLKICKDIGFKHKRGVILYGPSGTGKTHLARQLSKKLLKCTTLKIVNGPELISKWIGQGEENVRYLFKESDEGTENDLHVIILDEFDSLCSARGSKSHGDDIVNQFLSKIDGVTESKNNFLIFGLTNRIDKIDKAIMRPGRLDVHIEIGYPNFEGKCQILKIYLDKIKKHFQLDKDLTIENIVQDYLKENISGARIECMINEIVSKKLYTGDRIIKRNDFIDLLSNEII